MFDLRCGALKAGMEKGTGGVEICGETGAGEDVESKPGVASAPGGVASVKPVEDCSDLTWMLASLAMCRVPPGAASPGAASVSCRVNFKLTPVQLCWDDYWILLLELHSGFGLVIILTVV